ncbi:hypothetical protein ACFVFQ_03390 [Streptomyces sp. NPDC057743]|uniref:hypothetical protein n=1 Tax=Streptomyces sp. NPDC057743 TaxID=3346236 RepID=UPI003698773E
MGWTILYLAFGLVALWLLGEVLFQHKAPLHWRLLALGGFLGVVAGVAIPSIIVIALGAIAFAVGQTYVTLSVRRGYEEGWTIGGRPKPSRRRRARSSRAPAAEPKLQVSGLTEETAPAAGAVEASDPAGHGADGHGAEGTGGQAPYPSQPDPSAPGAVDATATFGAVGEVPAAAQDFGYVPVDATAVYAPQPMPDETGAYGIYSPDARPEPAVGYDLFGNPTSDGDANGHGYGGGYGPTPGHDGYADPYPSYDNGAYQSGHGPYSDPYIGTQQYAAHYDPYEEPDPFGRAPHQAGSYDPLGGQPAQHYPQGYPPETPPGGVWMPQQRETGHPEEQQPYPPQQPGYDEQRYHY